MANASGWNNTDVTVSFSCADALSGVDGCSTPLTLATEGLAQVVSGSVSDLAGNTASTSVSLNIDKTAPQVGITEPLDGAVIMAAETNVIGTIDDNTATATVNGVGATVASNAFTATAVSLVEGVNTLTVTATDPADNTGSASATVTHTAVLPSIEITSPLEGALLASSRFGHRIDGTVIDPYSTLSAVTVNGSAAVVTGDTFYAYIYLPSGDTTITAVATYGTDGTKESSISVYQDVTRPDISITGVTNNQIGNQDITPVITMTDDYGIDPERVVTTLNGQPYVSGTPITADGTYTLYVMAYDYVSNRMYTSISFTIDKIAPILNLNKSLDGFITQYSSIPVKGSVIDDNPSTVTINGEIVNMGSYNNPNNFSNNFTITEGPNTITVTATDLAGNVSESDYFSITRDSIAPVVTITSPLAGDIFTTSPIEVTGTVDDNTATVTVNGIPATVVNNTFTAIGIELTGGGTRTIRAYAKDSADNSSFYDVNIDYLPDMANPPVVEITSPADGSIVNTPTINVFGTAIDDNISHVSVNGVNANLSGTTDNFYAYSVPLNEGPNDLIATAKDDTGNETTATINVTLDTTPPVISITSPYEGATLTGQTANVTGTIDDDTATVSVNGVNTTVSNGTFTTVMGVPLNEGANVITALARDVAGNEVTASINVTNELIAPVITIMEPHNGAVIGVSSFVVKGNVYSATAQEIGVTVNGVIAEINGNDFAAVIALLPGTNTITAVATAADLYSGEDTTTIESVADPKSIEVSVSPSSGIISTQSGVLEVIFSAQAYISNPVADYSWDVDGDGTYDITGVDSEVTAQYHYAGLYYPKVKVTDTFGISYHEYFLVNALSEAEIDNLLQSKWTAVMEALAQGDVNAAIDLFLDSSQQAYLEQFNAFSPVLSVIANDMQDIRLVSVEGNAAEYEIITLRSGTAYSYYLLFVRDSNGLWKIKVF